MMILRCLYVGGEYLRKFDRDQRFAFFAIRYDDTALH
jgi:hypothetical protein